MPGWGFVMDETLQWKIACVIEDVDQQDGDIDELANAIITELPNMVPDLVWERADLSCWGETAQNGMGGSYRLRWKFGDGPNGEDTSFTVQFNGVNLYSGWSFDADLAMAAANAHRRAAWIAILTGGVS